MKQNLLSGLKILSLSLIVFLFQAMIANNAQAQIYEPEGLNMPGAWDTWTNPPTNLALASSTQVAGGRIVKFSLGQTRWQTIFSVSASGADLVGGTYEWLFTSGSSSNYFQNKWSNVTVVMNTLQTYTKEGPNNNSVTLLNGKWYTVNWEDLGYQDSRAIFMETSAEPVTIASVSVPATVVENEPVTIQIATAASPSDEEIIYLRYTNDSWITSQVLAVSMAGSNGTVEIPGQPTGTTVSYYAFTSTVAALTADFDLYSIHLNNNDGLNYMYSIGPPPPPVINWANLQWPGTGAIETGGAYDVYGQAFIMGVTGQPDPAPGLQAWVGYSTNNSNPDTWTNWALAVHNGPAGSNDEFRADIGSLIAAPGTYYYATRYQLNADPFVYGGFSESGGGFWDGTDNVSGVLTVTDPITSPDFDWINLQFPGNAAISLGGDMDVYAQVLIEGVTGQPTPAPGIEAWIGYSLNNTNPSEWTEWFPASFNAPSGNNDEYMFNLGQNITETGIYYYASRFSLNGGDFYYGGYSDSGGGFWNGTLNVSGVLTVTEVQPTFPVLFTIIDGTMLHDAIKLKGEMTSWDTIAMTPDNHVWTKTLDLQPGNYEWGAIEDDGTEFGLWLIEGGNLIMTVGDDGSISGTVTYTTMVTNTQTLPFGSKIYPNPAYDALNVVVPGLNGVRLIDMSGQILREFVSLSDAIRLDLSGINPGIIQLQINTAKKTYSQKVVKF